MNTVETIVSVEETFLECLKIVKEKDKKYGSMWAEEDLEELWGNVSRKFKGVQYQLAEGLVDKEFPLDLINYVVFLYLRLKKGELLLED